MQRLIWFCTVCRCPKKRTIGLYGLMKICLCRFTKFGHLENTLRLPIPTYRPYLNTKSAIRSVCWHNAFNHANFLYKLQGLNVGFHLVIYHMKPPIKTAATFLPKVPLCSMKENSINDCHFADHEKVKTNGILAIRKPRSYQLRLLPYILCKYNCRPWPACTWVQASSEPSVSRRLERKRLVRKCEHEFETIFVAVYDT